LYGSRNTTTNQAKAGFSDTLESLGDNRKRAHFVGLFDSYLPLHALTETHLEGAGLFQNDCATCHAANGHTRSRWQVDFQRLPPDLFTGPYLHLPASDTAAQRGLRLACIVRFGIPGTDMPG